MFEHEWNLLSSIFRLPTPPRTGTFTDEKRIVDSLFQLPTLGGTPPATPMANTESDTARAKGEPDPMTRQKVTKERSEVAPEPSAQGGQMGSFGAALDPSAMVPGRNNVTMPKGAVNNDAAIKAAMLQAGLSMLSPSWGGPMAQTAQAVGQGAEAFTRVKDRGPAEEARQLQMEKTRAEIEGEKTLATYRGEAAKTSRATRLKDKTDKSTEFERLAKGIGLGPTGQAYLKLQMKTFDDPLADGAELDPVTRFNNLVSQARELDPAADTPAEGKPPAGGAKIEGVEGNGVVQVKSFEEAQKLPSGTRFRVPGETDIRTRN